MRRTILLVLIVAGGTLAFLAARNLLNTPDPVTLSSASAVPLEGRPGVLNVYLKLENGDTPNRLISVTSAEADAAVLSGAVTAQGVVLPAASAPSLSSDGVYLQLFGVTGALDEGRLIPVSLEFTPSGIATTRARIGPPVAEHADHDPNAVAPGTDGATPEISMTLTQTETGGYDVALQTANFTFVPDADDPKHVPGEGHGHLYLNGVKLQRMYSETARMGALPPGRHIVTVSLNSNTHELYVTADGPVSASQIIDVD